MLDMKNAFLSSSSSQFYASGNADFQMIMDHNLGFCMVNELIHEDFADPYELSISHDYLDFPGFTSNSDRLARRSEEDDLVSQKTSNNLVESRSTAAKRCNGSSSSSSKRIKRASFEEHSHPQPQHTTKLHLPSRRSQKLGDKITVLQKLVSPYGKTNTVAVLEEASLYIKHLQQQIQTLSKSYNANTETQFQDDEERGRDLRSRGLCLVPVSFSGKVTADEDPTDFLEKFKVPRNLC